MLPIGALLTALEPLAAQLLAGTSLSAALSATTMPQWFTMAGAVANLVAPSFAKKVETEINLHPDVIKFIEDVIQHGPETAAKTSFEKWCAANGEGAIKLETEKDKDY